MKFIKFYSFVGYCLLIWGWVFGGFLIGHLWDYSDQLNVITNERVIIYCFMNLYIPTTIGSIIFLFIRNSIKNSNHVGLLFLSYCMHTWAGLFAFIMFLIKSVHNPFEIKARGIDSEYLFFACLSFSLIIGALQGFILYFEKENKTSGKS